MTPQELRRLIEKHEKSLAKCIAKVRYGTKQDAELHADKMWSKKGMMLRSYHCTHCSKYHLTSQKVR